MSKDGIIQNLFVIKQLVSRDIKRRYNRSYLGILWSVLNPLLMMSAISVIFVQIFNRTVDNYPLYYLSGYILWQLFSEATNLSMSAMVDNRVLMTKIKMPKIIFPLSRVCSSVVNLFYTFIAYILIMMFFRVEPSITMICAPVIIICLFIFALGLGYVLSALYVFFGDIKYLYSVVLTIWMYFSALFYPISSLNIQTQAIIEKNPMYNFVTCFRNIMIYQTWPDQGQWLQMIIWSIGSLMIGYFIFKKLENRMMQYL